MRKITLLLISMAYIVAVGQNNQSTIAEELAAQEQLTQMGNSVIDVNDLFTKYDNLGPQTGEITEFFTPLEISLMRAQKKKERFVVRGGEADWIPTAGATETFEPSVGDFFYDTGGPGGSPYPSYDGPGDYINCGCTTYTTLAGVSQIEFIDFSIFATFDWLRIYDGTDTSGVLLYDNSSGGMNAGDILLADMIASHGSTIFTAASGNFHFEFYASTVVAYLGWEVEILQASGGGGGDPVAYGFEAAAYGFGNFDLADPSVFNTVSGGSGTSGFEGAGAISHNDPTLGYAIDNIGNMYQIDVPSGTYTLLGNVGVSDITGLEFNPVDNSLWAVRGEGSGGHLYSVNPADPSVTLIGNMGIPAGDFALALGIDADGNFYTFETNIITNSNLYSIDPTTGAATVIGSLGFQANFGQGMGFDTSTNTMYMSAFNNLTFDAELRTVNLATGLSTLVGSIVPGELTQVAWMSIIGDSSGGGDCEPGVMELPFDASFNQFAGNMFDVAAIGGEDVIIEGFDVNIDPGTATIAVYYREGTYVGFENSSAGWTLLGTEVVTSAGENMPTHVEIGGVTIPDGETYGFYVSVTDYDVSGVSMNYTNGNNTFTDSYVEVTLGAGKGSPDFLGATFADRIWNGNIYYCAGEGGGGGDCSSPVVDINQDEFNTCMAFIGQTGIAQSFTAESSMSAGAGFMFTTTVAAGQTLEVGLWDNLPNAGGVLLTSGSVTTPGGDAWVDVFWDTPASTTIGDMYYLVVEGTVLECMAGTTYDSYPGGNVYANSGYTPFPNYDYTFRHYGCEGGGGGGDCEWEVHVFDNSGNFGDEVSWQLLDGSTVLLSGGPYFTTPYNDVQTIMAGNGPLTFHISSMGVFNDNTPSYTVTAGGTVVASGTLTGGTEAIHEDLMCDGSGGGNDPVGDCDEANERGTTIVDGLNCSANSSYKTANDLTVPADKDFHLEQIRANILSIGNITDVDIYYYDNSGTLPGAQIGSELGIVPSAQNHTGSAFGYDVYEIILDIPTYIFAGQTGSTTTYWIELSVDNTSSSGSIFWELTNENSQGNPAALFDGGWMVWDPTMDGVYLWGGNCVEIISSEEMTISGFSYYPNPASDVIYLQADQIIDSVDLYNVLGQQVLSQSVKAQSSQLDVSGLAAGTYLMSVESEGTLHTYQVIKM